jgi:hypothetical protein
MSNESMLADLAGLAGQVDAGLFTEGLEALPGFGYRSKSDTPDDHGSFIINVDTWPLDDPQNSTWVPADYEDGPVWLAKLVRVLPVVARRRKIATDMNDVQHFYDLRTPRRQILEELPDARINNHTQVLLMMADPSGDAPVGGIETPQLYIFGMRGYTTCQSWDNPNPKGPRGRFFDQTFKIMGVEAMMEEYAQWLRGESGLRDLPAYCLSWVDLIPAYEGGKPMRVTVGKKRATSTVNPFTATFASGDSMKVFPIAQRFVGKDLFLRAQDIARDHQGWRRWEDSLDISGTPNSDALISDPYEKDQDRSHNSDESPPWAESADEEYAF